MDQVSPAIDRKEENINSELFNLLRLLTGPSTTSHLSRVIRTQYTAANIALLRPYLTSLLASPTTTPDSVRPALPADAAKSSHILLPVPNQGHTPPNTGPYWSLLVVSTLDSLAFHYTVRPDPTGAGAVAGDDAARKASEKLGAMLGLELRYRSVPVPNYTAPAGSDCGLAVCALLRYLLLRRLLAVPVNERTSMGLDSVALDSAAVKKALLEEVVDSGCGDDDTVPRLALLDGEGLGWGIVELGGDSGTLGFWERWGFRK